MSIPVALQLYSVRDETAKDFSGTLEKVASIGYSGVEFAGYGGLAADRLHSLLARLRLVPVASHVPLDELGKDIDGVAVYSKALGCPRVVCPWAPVTDQAAVDDYSKRFNEWGRKLHEKGIEFFYHNHDHEFSKTGAEYTLDVLLRETDPSNVKMELDTCWVQAGGADPAAYVRKYAGRCPIIHIKDMKPGKGKVLTEVGNGVVNVSRIVREAAAAGVQWLIVEQDSGERPTLESTGISFLALQKIQQELR